MKRGCCADCIGWNADVFYTLGGRDYHSAGPPFLNMNRQHTCTCLCFNRPVVDIHEVATGNKVGSIQDPFACCDLTFTLRDPNEEEVLLAKGGCCQWGLCCPLPCGPCSTVH